MGRWSGVKGLGLAASLWALSGPAAALDEAQVSQTLAFAQEQLRRTSTKIPTTSYPTSTNPDDTWRVVSNTELLGWTQGFFPGSLWYMYQRTQDASWKTLADSWTSSLEVQQGNTQTHDLGFKMFLSFGHGYRLTGDERYKRVLLTAAGSLASRYNPKIGAISAGDWNPKWHLPVVIDTMMNLELLLWASQNGGQASWRDMALNHGLRTIADLVRPDGSTFHVVDYDPGTGATLSRGTYQGYSDASTWARGQAWAIYGFTMVYRYTRDERMLDAARRVADWYLSHLPPDAVPNWDFNAPSQRKDSSAAAVVASALLELSGFVPDPATQQRYRDAAIQMLDALCSPAYLAAGTSSPSVLLHGVGNYPANKEVDVGLVYGDYYFIEALLRFHDEAVPPEEIPENPPLEQPRPGGCSCAATPAPGFGSGTAVGLLVALGLRRLSRSSRSLAQSDRRRPRLLGR